MTTSTNGSEPGAAWLEIIRRDEAEFSQAFEVDVVLVASVLTTGMRGVDAVRRFFEATKLMYDDIAFTGELDVDDRTLLEWQGHFADKDVSGVTLLIYSDRRRIREIRLFHQPFEQVKQFAERLANLLGNPSDFTATSPHKEQQ
jgi:hypothetical protein